MSPPCCVGSGGRQLLTPWILVFLPAPEDGWGVISTLALQAISRALVCWFVWRRSSQTKAGGRWVTPGLVLTGVQVPERCVEKDSQAGSGLDGEQCPDQRAMSATQAGAPVEGARLVFATLALSLKRTSAAHCRGLR